MSSFFRKSQPAPPKPVGGNPPAEDGYVGKLTPEQEQKLKQFWAQVFKLTDDAPTTGNGQVANKSSDLPKDEKEAVKNTPKGDEAKAAALAAEELKNAKAVFTNHGSIRFRQSFWNFIQMNHPDQMVLKFLRARKWDVTAAVAMFASGIKWRIESDVEKIFAKGEEGLKDNAEFLKQLRSGKGYLQGTDRHGRPVIYIHVARHRTFDQSPKALEDLVIFQMECARLVIVPPLDKVTMIFDMTNFGLANMDWRCILFIVKVLESYYPESLNVCLIHNAPWIFQGIWKILYPMLDPVVRAKVEFTRTVDDLNVHVDKSHLVKHIGGTSTWDYKYIELGENENPKQADKEYVAETKAAHQKLIDSFEAVTREWINSNDAVVAKKREYLAARLREHYWTLDPCIRGRGYYHRAKNVLEDGVVQFKYSAEGEDWEVIGKDVSQGATAAHAEKLAAEIKEAGAALP